VNKSGDEYSLSRSRHSGDAEPDGGIDEMAAEFQQRSGAHPGLLEYLRNRIAHMVTFVRHSYDDARFIPLGRKIPFSGNEDFCVQS
jgi:hypothetical protein